MLAALEHQEMNKKVEVTWRTLHTIAHYLMVHARFSEAYTYFALMYTTDHIFPVIPIKDLINKDNNPTTSFRLATSTKHSVSHLNVFFFHVLYGKILYFLQKGVKYESPSTKGFSRYLRCNSTTSKSISFVRTEYKEDNIFI